MRAQLKVSSMSSSMTFAVMNSSSSHPSTSPSLVIMSSPFSSYTSNSWNKHPQLDVWYLKLFLTLCQATTYRSISLQSWHDDMTWCYWFRLELLKFLPQRPDDENQNKQWETVSSHLLQHLGLQIFQMSQSLDILHLIPYCFQDQATFCFYQYLKENS